MGRRENGARKMHFPTHKKNKTHRSQLIGLIGVASTWWNKVLGKVQLGNEKWHENLWSDWARDCVQLLQLLKLLLLLLLLLFACRICCRWSDKLAGAPRRALMIELTWRKGRRKLPANEVLSCQRHCQRHVSSCSSATPSLPLSLSLSGFAWSALCDKLELNFLRKATAKGTTAATDCTITTTTSGTTTTTTVTTNWLTTPADDATWLKVDEGVAIIKRVFERLLSCLHLPDRTQCIHILHNKFINRAEKEEAVEEEWNGVEEEEDEAVGSKKERSKEFKLRK